jgi:pimeloyl-ACP methyl ester carboxylesterase
MTKAVQDSKQAPWSFAEPWGGRSYVSDLGGPVHWVDFGGTTSGPPIVLVHGLGGSHLNWVRIAPGLAQRTRVLALDLTGFGLTVPDGRRTDVRANAALLDNFVREIVGSPAVLIGNSMGGMISVLHSHARPDSVAGLVLVDSALPTPRQRPDLQVAGEFLLYAIPFVGERYLALGRRRLSDRQLVQRVVDLCFADPTRASETVMEAGTALAGHRRSFSGQEAAFLQAARSLIWVLGRPGAYRTMMSNLDLPVLLIHGERDRLVPVAAALRAIADNPDWDSVILKDVGHTPQLESPGLVVESILDWLDRHEFSSPAAPESQRDGYDA